MQLDFRTLVVAVTLSAAFCAAARVLLWRMHPSVPGLGQWAGAGIASALALALFGFFGLTVDWLGASLPHLLVSLGLTLAWDGFRRFLGRTPLQPLHIAALTLVVTVPVAIAHLQSWLALRALANSLLMGAMSLAIARELLRPTPWRAAAARATGFLYLFNAVFFLLRLLTVLRDGGQAFNSDFASASLLWWMCMTVAVTLGMALMTGERLQGDLDRQASRDPLTGTLNRRAFATLAERELARARRAGHPLSLLMMDLDHFKQVNDRLGHAAGDDALCRFVAVAEKQLRTEDVLARFGGEEFVALLPDTSADKALAAAERLRVAFSQATGGPPGHVFTVSMGVAELRPDEDLETTLRRADHALYRAKEGGRDRSELADETAPTLVLQQSL